MHKKLRTSSLLSLQMRTSVRERRFAARPPATTRWAATSACVPLALTLIRVPVAAKM